MSGVPSRNDHALTLSGAFPLPTTIANGQKLFARPNAHRLIKSCCDNEGYDSAWVCHTPRSRSLLECHSCASLRQRAGSSSSHVTPARSSRCGGVATDKTKPRGSFASTKSWPPRSTSRIPWRYEHNNDATRSATNKSRDGCGQCQCHGDSARRWAMAPSESTAGSSQVEAGHCRCPAWWRRAPGR